MKTLICNRGHQLTVSDYDFLSCGASIPYMRCTLCGSAIVGSLPTLMEEEPKPDTPRRRDDELMGGMFTSDNEIFKTEPVVEEFKSGGGGDFGGAGASGSWESSDSSSSSSDSSSSDSSSDSSSSSDS